MLWTTSSKVSKVDTCMDENSEHTTNMLSYFLSDHRYEPDHNSGGIQNLSIEEVIKLTNSEHRELCSQLKQTSLLINDPGSTINTSFFMSSNRRFIVHFFLDSLPIYEEATFYFGPIGIISILDADMEHVHSILIR